jgi:hypothetical protein
MVHVVAILLFPVRLVTAPIAVPVIDGMLKAVSQLGGPSYPFWHNILPIAKMWLLWQV